MELSFGSGFDGVGKSSINGCRDSAGARNLKSGRSQSRRGHYSLSVLAGDLLFCSLISHMPLTWLFDVGLSVVSSSVSQPNPYFLHKQIFLSCTSVGGARHPPWGARPPTPCWCRRCIGITSKEWAALALVLRHSDAEHLMNLNLYRVNNSEDM